MDLPALKAKREHARRRLLTASREALMNPDRRAMLTRQLEEIERAIALAQHGRRPLHGRAR